MSFAEMTSVLTNQSYKLGTSDCFMIVYQFIKMKMPDVTDEHQGVSIKDYSELYKADPKRAKDIMIDAIQSNLKEINPISSLAGDILLLQFRNQSVFLGLDSGHGKVMVASPNHGIVQVPKHIYKILRVFRCQQPSQS